MIPTSPKVLTEWNEYEQGKQSEGELTKARGKAPRETKASCLTLKVDLKFACVKCR